VNLGTTEARMLGWKMSHLALHYSYMTCKSCLFN